MNFHIRALPKLALAPLLSIGAWAAPVGAQSTDRLAVLVAPFATPAAHVGRGLAADVAELLATNQELRTVTWNAFVARSIEPVPNDVNQAPWASCNFARRTADAHGIDVVLCGSFRPDGDGGFALRTLIVPASGAKETVVGPWTTPDRPNAAQQVTADLLDWIQTSEANRFE